MPGMSSMTFFSPQMRLKAGRVGSHEIEVVLNARVGLPILHLIGRSVGLGDAFEDAVHLLDDAIAERRIIGAHGATELYFFSDDVLPITTVDGANADDQGLTGVGLAALDQLQGHHGFCCNSDGIDPFVRCRAVSHFAVDGDVKAVAVGVIDAGRVADLAGLQVVDTIVSGTRRLDYRRGVQAKDGSRFGILQHTLLQP